MPVCAHWAARTQCHGTRSQLYLIAHTFGSFANHGQQGRNTHCVTARSVDCGCLSMHLASAFTRRVVGRSRGHSQSQARSDAGSGNRPESFDFPWPLFLHLVLVCADLLYFFSLTLLQIFTFRRCRASNGLLDFSVLLWLHKPSQCLALAVHRHYFRRSLLSFCQGLCRSLPP